MDLMRTSFVISASDAQKLNKALQYAVLGLLLFSMAALAYYQMSYLAMQHPRMPFFEPDNYEYYLFAQLAIVHPALNASTLLNPYYVYTIAGFFEHAGLYLMPVWIYDITHISLVWDFRILQLLAVIVIYVFSLLLSFIIMNKTFLTRTYRYFVYILILSSGLLMSYTELMEWRGNEFITALSLIMVYAMAYVFTDGGASWIKVGAIALLLLLPLIGIWIWSGGVILLVLAAILFASLLLYKIVLHWHIRFWAYLAVAIVVLAVVIYFGWAEIDTMLIAIGGQFLVGSCLNNLLHLGEAECLTPANGLMSILMMMLFSSLAIITFMGKTIMSEKKKHYEYYFIAIMVVGYAELPMALIYLRLVDMVAPYFIIMYALGTVSLLTYFSKAGSSKIIIMLTMILILIANLGGQYLFYRSNILLYEYANPSGLAMAGQYLAAYPNSTVFAYYGYGDWLEAIGHERVYADTIQGLNASRIMDMDTAFLSNASGACRIITSFKPMPDFVMIGRSMLNSSLSINASNSSILKEPLSFGNECGYGLVYNNQGFELFKVVG